MEVSKYSKFEVGLMMTKIEVFAVIREENAVILLSKSAIRK